MCMLNCDNIQYVAFHLLLSWMILSVDHNVPVHYRSTAAMQKSGGPFLIFQPLTLFTLEGAQNQVLMLRDEKMDWAQDCQNLG